MTIKATAPTRMDLAGGTLDIWPLYLFMEEGITVNAAIDINSHVLVEERSDPEIHLRAADADEALWAPSLDQLPVANQLDLIARIVRFYAPRTGVNIATSSDAPRGSGLGASSSLLITLSHVLNKLTGSRYTPEQIIDMGANIEAQCIRIPTGKQDYYPPTYGGVNAIWFRVDGNKLESLGGEELAVELERRVILSFTGISHFSGTNNWNMMKRYIESKGTTVENLRRIKETASKIRECLLARDFAWFAQLVDEEWQNRKSLARGVSNARIERIMAAAKEAGALASKICGAGGGGCMITVTEPESRQAVEEALTRSGAKVMPYRIARKGVQMEEVA
ncbi:MAG: GHMP family kinase ATP-binding protein [Armatimonadota bacterium]